MLTLTSGSIRHDCCSDHNVWGELMHITKHAIFSQNQSWYLASSTVHTIQFFNVI